LIVPGWYSTYWVKMLNDVEVLNPPEELLNEDGLSQSRKPYASVKPSESAFRTMPINRMVPRSFFTNVSNNPIVKPAVPVPVRGIAFDEVVVQVTPGCEVMIDEGRAPSCPRLRGINRIWAAKNPRNAAWGFLRRIFGQFQQ
jgi:hypothetical protein